MIGDKEREERLLVRRDTLTNQRPGWAELTNEEPASLDNEGRDSG